MPIQKLVQVLRARTGAEDPAQHQGRRGIRGDPQSIHGLFLYEREGQEGQQDVQYAKAYTIGQPVVQKRNLTTVPC